MAEGNGYRQITPYARIKRMNGAFFLRVNADANPDKRDFYEVIIDLEGKDSLKASNYRIAGMDFILLTKRNTKGQQESAFQL